MIREVVNDPILSVQKKFSKKKIDINFVCMPVFKYFVMFECVKSAKFFIVDVEVSLESGNFCPRTRQKRSGFSTFFTGFETILGPDHGLVRFPG